MSTLFLNMDPRKLLILVLLALTQSSDGRKSWEEYAHELRIDEFLRPLLPEVLLSRKLLPESSNCSLDLATYRQAIARRESWAVRMLDSSSKMPTGLLNGNLIDLGSFDQCLEVTSGEIRGRPCMYSLRPIIIAENDIPLNPALSICLPASCNETDVELMVKEIISEFDDNLQDLEVKVANVHCANEKPKTFSTNLIIFLLFLGVYIAFLSFCTYCDAHISKGHIQWIKPRLLKILVNFSMLRSAKAIYNLSVDKESFPVINGMRVLSNLGVLWAHIVFFQMLENNANLFVGTRLYDAFSGTGLFIGNFCVDTFFALNGFLLVYGFFKKLQAGKKLSLLQYYLRRYIRLTLPMLVIAFSVVYLAPFFDIGPRHKLFTSVFVEGCESKLWCYFIYAHNIFRRDNVCMVHLWYLAAEMQLYLISPLIFYPLYKKPKTGLYIIMTLLLICMITTAVNFRVNEYSAICVTPDLHLVKSVSCLANGHTTTYSRASPWLIGILFGYKVVQEKSKPNKMTLLLGWFLAFLGFTSVCLGIKVLTNVHYEHNATYEFIFAAITKPIWAFSICWIVYASLHNFGGIISTILSAKIFVPLSRLSFSMYLVHPLMYVIKLGTARTPAYIHQQFMVFHFIEMWATALVFGFFYSIVFEAPMYVLDFGLFQKKAKLDPSEDQTISEKKQ